MRDATDATEGKVITGDSGVEDCRRIRREFELLFDQVPCNIIIIDRDYNIVRTNERARKIIGQIEGKPCYKSLKGREYRCDECTAAQTFEDGRQHTGHHVWQSKTGQTLHLHVITVPLKNDNGTFDTIMELAVDVTQTRKLEAGLQIANHYFEALIDTSMDGIFAVEGKGKVTIFNPAARKLFRVDGNRIISREEVAAMMPKGFLALVSDATKSVYLPETEVRTIDGRAVPVRLVGSRLTHDGQNMGMAFSIQDLGEIKKLEKEKLESERFAAVGQTVAGLAHGLKNLINALQGGLYMLNSGFKNSSLDRLQKGMETINRNSDRMATTVKAFLNFAKQSPLSPSVINPVVIVGEVIEVFAAKAEEKGVGFAYELVEDMAPAPLDHDVLYGCLSNLVDNAIDACLEDSSKDAHAVIVRTYEDEGAIVFEVEDNGMGMDYEVKKKIFSRFFTTKGLNGTGLGLLMTKKGVQEHGGMIDLSSIPRKGSTMRIRLPRHRLSHPKPD
jgi:PAS domain S-box-containing protein